MGLGGLTRRQPRRCREHHVSHSGARAGGAARVSALTTRETARARPESDPTPREKWFYLMVITGPPESLRV